VSTILAATGFGFGTTAGWVTGNTGNRILDSATAGASVVTTNPRTGSYCAELVGVASIQNIKWSTNTLGASKVRVVATFAVYLPSPLPSANTDLATFETAAAVSGMIFFDQPSGKLGAKISSGTAQLGPLLAADTWTRLDVIFECSASPFTLDWRVNGGSAQTQATFANAASTITNADLGWTANSTATVRYADWVVSTTLADYPLGDHKVVLLTVDPAGTVTLSGTAANFNTFTANGTLAAWNATVARDNTVEVPVTVGASAAGWVQVTLLSTDYVEMPMTSYQLAVGESIAALRMLAPGWATSTTAATIGFRSWNGTTETILLAAADPNFDNTSTPAWVCKMCTLADFDTQTELDALAFRAGFSTDATPDIGIHAIYAELAVARAAIAVKPPRIWQAVARASYR
jgi:hypothetical protein